MRRRRCKNFPHSHCLAGRAPDHAAVNCATERRQRHRFLRNPGDPLLNAVRRNTTPCKRVSHVVETLPQLRRSACRRWGIAPHPTAASSRLPPDAVSPRSFLRLFPQPPPPLPLSARALLRLSRPLLLSRPRDESTHLLLELPFLFELRRFSRRRLERGRIFPCSRGLCSRCLFLWPAECVCHQTGVD